MHRIWMMFDPRRTLIALFTFLLLLALLIHGALLNTSRYNWLGARQGLGPGAAMPATAMRAPAAAPAAPVAAPVAAPAAAAPAPAATAAANSVYFAVGAAAIDAEGAAVVRQAVAALQAAPTARVAITGYTDATGNVAANQELAKNRAVAVRDALEQAGIARDRIDMRPPESVQANAAGDDRASRRVDVTVTP